MQRRLKQNDGFYTQNRSRVAEEAGKGDKGPAKMQKKLCFLRFLVDLAPKTTYEDGRTKLKVSETRPPGFGASLALGIGPGEREKEEGGEC